MNGKNALEESKGRTTLTGSAGRSITPADVSPAKLTTAELVARIAQDAQNLVKAEIQLARTELRADVQAAAATAQRMGIAVGLAIAGAAMLLATLVLVLDLFLPTWAAALIVTVALLAGAGIAFVMGRKSSHVRPLERTRRNLKDLKEELSWAKTREKTA